MNSELKPKQEITQTTEEDKKPGKVNWMREIFSWLIVILAGISLAWIVTRVIIVKAVVPTNSMETTIMVDDKIIGNRLAYLFSNPKRGDIVIFKYPDNPEEDYVKRVIGIPGDKIELKEGKVYINGEEQDEPYVHGAETLAHGQDTYIVPDGCYFMMGDNRTSSWDARCWINTFVKKNAIKGKVLFRYSPSWGKIK